MSSPVTWRFDGQTVVQNQYAAIQLGISPTDIQEVLDQYPYQRRHGLIILELERERSGFDHVTEVETGDEVRYAYDPNSKARPHNRPMAPFVLAEEMPVTNTMSVYVIWIKRQGLNLVRAHFGSPYPPLPTTSSAQNWPGHPSQGMGPGRYGCKAFWRDHALITTDRKTFHSMSPCKPIELR